MPLPSVMNALALATAVAKSGVKVSDDGLYPIYPKRRKVPASAGDMLPARLFEDENVDSALEESEIEGAVADVGGAYKNLFVRFDHLHANIIAVYKPATRC